MARNAQQGRAWLLLNGGLLGLLLWTAIAVIDVSHRCRELYAGLQVLQRDQWDMQENWYRLLLEESARATYHEVEKEAESRLGMRYPAVAEIRRVLR